MLAGHDWQQGLGDPGGGGGDPYASFWFDGYGPRQPQPHAPGNTLPPSPPVSGAGSAPVGMTINDGALYTNDPDVTLSVIAPSGAGSLRVSNDGGFRAATTFPVRSTIPWRLAESGPERLPKTVYLRFGNQALTFTDDIILDQTNPTVTAATVDSPEAAPATSGIVHAAMSRSRIYSVRVGARDATSGVAKMQFAPYSKRHPGALRKFERISRYKGTRVPRYVRVRDRAGNYSRWHSIR